MELQYDLKSVIVQVSLWLLAFTWLPLLKQIRTKIYAKQMFIGREDLQELPLSIGEICSNMITCPMGVAPTSHW